MLRLFRRPESTANYLRLRAAGGSLIAKFHETEVFKEFDLVKAAKKLTLPVMGKTFIFESESDSAALMDFFLHEFFKGGRRLIDCCVAEGMKLTPDEREMLEAHRSARTSLFEIVSLDPKQAQLRLKDLLAPERPEVILTDVAMSQMGKLSKEVLLFVRVVSCQGTAMSSGSSFAFPRQHCERLLNAYALRMKTVVPSERSQRAFIFFFQQHRVLGMNQAFSEPEGAGSR
jgi:hypothetical protein